MDTNTLNLWDTKIGKDNFVYFDNVEDFIKFITENNLSFDFNLKEKFTTEMEPSDFIEQMALSENTNLIFTDANHPIAVSKLSFASSIIDPTFYNEHKEEFVKYYKEILKEKLSDPNNDYIHIYDFAFDDSLFKEVIKNSNKNYKYHLVEGIELSSQKIKEIQDKHIQFEVGKNGKYNEISTNKAFYHYTFDDLKNKDSLIIYVNTLDNKEIKNLDNLVYLNPNATIKIFNDYGYNEYSDEKVFYENVKIIIDTLSKHSKSYNIKFNVENREIFKQSHLLDNMPNNINILIKNDLHTYDLNTYLKEEEKLEKLVEPIKNSNLSPFEKYLAVYNLVKQFKEYKENDEDKDESRHLRFILDNEYMVCVGFARLLETLLDKVGIPCKEISVSVDTSYDKGFTMDDTTVESVGHARNMINIDDDKYGIHGFYVADATWDNDLEKDLYFNSAMTFDRKKEAHRMEFLNDNDLLFDFHNLDDFKKKITFYIKRKVKDTVYDYANKGKPNNMTKEKYQKEFNDRYFNAYKTMFNDVLHVLKRLDYEKCNYFYNKYFELFKNFSSFRDTNINEATAKFNEFLNEYYNYIITKVNHKIDDKTLIDAASEVKRNIDGFSEEELKTWLEKQEEIKKESETKVFPYKYDSDMKEAFLEDALLQEDNTNKHIK